MDVGFEFLTFPLSTFPSPPPTKSMEKDYANWCDHYYDHLLNLYDIFLNLTRLSVEFNIFCSFVYSNSVPLRSTPGQIKFVRPLMKWI